MPLSPSAPHPRQPRQHPTTQFFTGRMPFLTPNQQRQSTEGSCNCWNGKNNKLSTSFWCMLKVDSNKYSSISAGENSQRCYPNWRKLVTWRGNICIQGMLGCIQYIMWRRNSCCRTEQLLSSYTGTSCFLCSNWRVEFQISLHESQCTTVFAICK